MEVNLSAILDLFGSKQSMSCPWAMSFFQRLCPGPFPPVSQGQHRQRPGGRRPQQLSLRWAWGVQQGSARSREPWLEVGSATLG